jgi:hypothetical protein
MVEEIDTHQPHMWSKSHVKCGVGLMNMIPLYRDIQKYTEMEFATKTSTPTTKLLLFSRENIYA